MSELGEQSDLEVPCELDDNGNRIEPPTTLYDAALRIPIPPKIDTIWESPFIHKYTTDNGKKWDCIHCNGSWCGHNATKALTHVGGSGQDITGCKGTIVPEWKQLYVDLRQRQLDKKAKRQNHNRVQHINADNRESAAVGLMTGQQPASSRSNIVDLVAPPKPTTDLATPSMNQIKRSLGSSMSAAAAHSSKKAKHQTAIVTTGGKNSPQAELELSMSIGHFLIAHSLPLSLGNCMLFKRILVRARSVNSNYKPPDKNKTSGPILNSLYTSYREAEVTKLLTDAHIFGLAIMSDGATICTTPNVNVIGCGEHNPGCVLDVIDCSEHMSSGGTKNADYLAEKTIPLMREIDPNGMLIDMMLFDGASNVQKAGEILAKYFPRSSVGHCPLHVVSLVFEKTIDLPPFDMYSKFCKIVSID